MPWKVGLDEPTQMQSEILKLGVACEKLEFNLALTNSAELLFNEVQDKFGQASVLVNNATYNTQTDIDNFPVTEVRQTL